MGGALETPRRKAWAIPALGSLFANRYRLVKSLGEGGMGCVFEAVDERLHRNVAIKILKPELSNESEFRIRFEREARAAALLRNRHAVRVFDVDITPEGAMYIVMELLVGRDIQREAQKKRVHARVVIEWIAQTCDALNEAHANGIVHRDVKPANILVTDDGGGRIAKVLDFGISKFSEHVTQSVTQPTGSMLGTPHYMAPEQLRGHRVDGRADIWAIGVTLYKILTGRLPFTAEGDGGYMSAVLTQSPYPVDKARADLPPDLARIIMHCIERLPSDRPATAEDVAAALRNIDWGWRKKQAAQPMMRGGGKTVPLATGAQGDGSVTLRMDHAMSDTELASLVPPSASPSDLPSMQTPTPVVPKLPVWPAFIIVALIALGIGGVVIRSRATKNGTSSAQPTMTADTTESAKGGLIPPPPPPSTTLTDDDQPPPQGSATAGATPASPSAASQRRFPGGRHSGQREQQSAPSTSPTAPHPTPTATTTLGPAFIE